MEDTFVNTVLNLPRQNSLSLSLRLIRLVLSALLIVVVATEITLSSTWQLVLSALAIYAFVTGMFGRDPVFALLRLTNCQLPDHALGVVAQLECLSIGLICIVAGIMHHNADSLILPLLPFFGIYPILLCAVKHDLLGYLLQSYRNDKRLKN